MLYCDSSAPLQTLQCSEIGLTISLMKINILGQEVSSIPSTSNGGYTLEVVEDFTYLHLGSNNLQQPFPCRHWTEQTNLQNSSRRKRVWDNTMLTISTKIKVYQACVLSTILYGSETWTLYFRQERRHNTLPQKDFGHHLARPCPKQGCLCTGASSWPCKPHGQLKNSQGHTLWRACHWI